MLRSIVSLPLQRNLFFDQFRGISLILMMIFHFAYDVDSHPTLQPFMENSTFWYYFPRVIAFLFFSLSGYLRGIIGPSSPKRLTPLFLSCLLVSISTYFIYPQHWIYFGTLHCLLFSQLLVQIPRICIPLFSLLYFSSFYWGPIIISSWDQSLDHLAIIPWGLFFLIFFFLGKFTKFWPIFHLKGIWGTFFSMLGRNSLKIYLLHRPIQVFLLELFLKMGLLHTLN